MASRCISTLNDLDKISNRIYHKHSKDRLRAGVETKLKASKEKADRSLQEIYEGSSYRSKESVNNRSSVGTSSATLSSRRFSTSAASTTSRSRTTEWHNIKRGKEKTQCKPSTSKSTNYAGQRDRIQRRKTKSCPSSSTDTKLDKNKDNQFDEGEVQHTMSVFGKYNGKGSEYKPTAWFNLPQETSVGVIDSFACDAMNKKPICYSIDVKKGESVPNLLWHNAEFRVGQNGIVRTEKKRDMVKSEVCDGDVKLGKKRTAPLSWEEQLQWHDACVISTAAHSDGNASPENLCETHPVIFHAKKPTEQEKCSKLDEEKNHSPVYKVGLESRWVYPDRRNLVSSYEKCIISMEVEDTRSSDEEACSAKQCQTQDAVNLSKNEMKQDLKVHERIPKKVSFEDEGIVSGKTVGNKMGKHLNDASVNETFEEVTATPTKTDDTRKDNFQLDIARKVRPRTSHEGSRKDDQETTKDVRKLRRPHTAPAAPPSSPRIFFDSRRNNCVPIKIPTSQGEVENNNFLLENQTNEEREEIIELSQSSSSEDESGSDVKGEDFPTFPIQISPGSPEKGAIQDDGVLAKKRVTFSKSAPIVRAVSRLEQTKVLRARSSSAVQRSWNRPSPPNVVEAESPLELPKNLPPSQALVALRKKIRDDLAQQNHELQLDIQQLYLRKHLE